MSEILMPQLSSSMENGTILSWLKQTGDEVQIGDEILEIETDKSTVTYAAEEPGLLNTLVEEGETVAVGTPIASIGESAPVSSGASDERAAVEARVAASDGEPVGVAGAADTPAATAAEPPAAATQSHAPAGFWPASAKNRSATPLARRVAAVHGVALDAVTGSGRLGRITRADVLAHAKAQDPTPFPKLSDRAASAQAPPVPLETLMLPGSRLQKPTRLQQLIARRMLTAKNTIPHFQVETEVTMDAAIALRGELKAVSGEGEPVPSLNDLIVKAAAIALREHPLANASYHDDGFVLHEQINIGIAVAAADALIVPTVLDAAGKSLGQIAQQTRALALKARDGQISPTELEGGTFTVSNLGMFGMTSIYPVVNPPQAAILGVGSLRPTLARTDGEIVDRTLMTLTLSCDHRILYGADAARFLARIRELLETPLRLLL